MWWWLLIEVAVFAGGLLAGPTLVLALRWWGRRRLSRSLWEEHRRSGRWPPG
jgi:hypothetical protein